MTKIKQFFQDANIGFEFKSMYRNPNWRPETQDPLRSSLIYYNATSGGTDFLVQKVPKWIIHLQYPSCVDTGSGEIIYEDYETNDFRVANNRKIKTVERFCDFYEPLYRSREISMLFHTFTRVEYSKKDMRRMIDKVKQHYEAISRPIRGYLWAMELSENAKMKHGYHIHYHLVVAIDRLSVEHMPEELKFNDIWGQRTQAAFIKKTIKGYLSKYLYKSDARVIGRRAYAISRKMR